MKSDTQAETLKRSGKDDMRREGAPEVGHFAERRSWIARTKDEVASWFGDTGAMRRRQWDEAAGDQSGKGPVRAMDDDARILDRLTQNLTADREVDASGIQASVSDGVVTLEGTVPTLASTHRAEGLASAVTGVRQVINKLVVS